MAEYVIIGNGTAAAGCIEGIRSVDRDGRITVVSAEKHAVYGRPLISYYLEGKTDRAHMNYRGADFYEKNGCRVLYGRSAVRIDDKTRTVHIDDGSALPYTSVCVAAGSSPFVPPFEGLDKVKNKFSFMTLDDAVALENAVGADTRVLIVGAGLIGLKCAEGLRARTMNITVCDLADRVLSSILDAESAMMMQKCIEKHGINLMLGDSVLRFEDGKAYMKSGKCVEFDALVLAVGVRANTSIVKELGGEVDRGVIVNTRMETSVPAVYAAGDCAQGDDVSSGTKKVLAIMPNAYLQGHCAGVNMAGGDEIFDKAMPLNSIGFFGLHAMTAGSYDGELFEEKAGNTLKRFFVRDDKLVGFMLIGATERAGIYTSLVREGIRLSSIDFEMLKKTATYAAFPPEIRCKKFGGVV